MFTIVTIQRLPEPATRAEADRLAAFTVAGEPVDEITASVVEGEPLILAGLVKRGECASLIEWEDLYDGDGIFVDATGRVRDEFDIRHRGAKFPISCYHYAAA